MKILLLEAFFGGSHKLWAEGLQKFSAHEIKFLTMPAKHWKWRMHNAAIGFAKEFKKLTFYPDLILATDMMDLALFKALSKTDLPCAIYFHENQLTYPWSPDDEDLKKDRDNHYGFTNYTSALAADAIFFNSQYHQNSFFKALENLLRKMPDQKNLETIQAITDKSKVLYLGMDLHTLAEGKRESNGIPTILWNHRWEYDKNPDEFFQALIQLKGKGYKFKLIILGEAFKKSPAIFEKAKQTLADEIIHFGYAADRASYQSLVKQADILPVSSHQDFFGGSIVEAISAGAYPLLPRRLTYPELIPDTLHTNYIYDTSLLEALEQLLKNWELRAKEHDLEKYFKKYDWPMIITAYDEAFEKTYADYQTKV